MNGPFGESQSLYRKSLCIIWANSQNAPTRSSVDVTGWPFCRLHIVTIVTLLRPPPLPRCGGWQGQDFLNTSRSSASF